PGSSSCTSSRLRTRKSSNARTTSSPHVAKDESFWLFWSAAARRRFGFLAFSRRQRHRKDPKRPPAAALQNCQNSQALSFPTPLRAPPHPPPPRRPHDPALPPSFCRRR